MINARSGNLCKGVTSSFQKKRSVRRPVLLAEGREDVAGQAVVQVEDPAGKSESCWPSSTKMAMAG